MKDTDTRELDAWIAEHVMGFEERPCYRGSARIEGMTFYVANGRSVTGEASKGNHQFPKYTTDPAAAMEVLKKCAEECDMPIEIDRKRDKKTGNWRIESGTMAQGLLAIAPPECNTLELAICLFAKKLFTK